MEQALEAVFPWSIRHHHSSVTPHVNAEVNPGASGTPSALSRNTLEDTNGGVPEGEFQPASLKVCSLAQLLGRP